MQKNRRQEIFFTAAFFLGFVLGIFFINLWGDTYFRDTAVLDKEALRTAGTAQIDRNRFFLYLLRLRGGAYAVLWLLGYTVASLPALSLSLCWLGFSSGVLLTMAVVQMQMAGVVVYLSFILPQAVIYGPAVLTLAAGMYERGSVRPKNRSREWEWDKEKQYLLTLLTGGLLTVLGAALEAYANPWLIGQTVKFFL